MHIIVVIIAALIIFAILVIVHEGGHFFAAKAVGIRVNEFALGMGPLIFQRQTKETKYSVRAFPIGGYVAMEGEDSDSDDARAFNKSGAGRCDTGNAGLRGGNPGRRPDRIG